MFKLNESRPPSPTTVGVVFVFVGLVFTSLGVWLIIDASRFNRDASTTQGTVVELIFVGDGRRAPRVDYRVNDARYTFTSRFSSTDLSFTTGDTVSVAYSLHNPADARIDSFETMWFLPLCATVVGAIGMMVGVGVLWFRH